MQFFFISETIFTGNQLTKIMSNESEKGHINGM